MCIYSETPKKKKRVSKTVPLVKDLPVVFVQNEKEAGPSDVFEWQNGKCLRLLKKLPEFV